MTLPFAHAVDWLSTALFSALLAVLSALIVRFAPLPLPPAMHAALAVGRIGLPLTLWLATVRATSPLGALGLFWYIVAVDVVAQAVIAWCASALAAYAQRHTAAGVLSARLRALADDPPEEESSA